MKPNAIPSSGLDDADGRSDRYHAASTAVTSRRERGIDWFRAYFITKCRFRIQG